MKRLTFVFVVLAVGALALTACTSLLYPPTPTPTTQALQALTTSTAPVVPSPSISPSPTPPSALVCTGYAEGALNVRRCPSTECQADFALVEGQRVVLTGRYAQSADGGRWVFIRAPVSGWVNRRYLCPSPTPTPTP